MGCGPTAEACRRFGERSRFSARAGSPFMVALTLYSQDGETRPERRHNGWANIGLRQGERSTEHECDARRGPRPGRTDPQAGGTTGACSGRPTDNRGRGHPPGERRSPRRRTHHRGLRCHAGGPRRQRGRTTRSSRRPPRSARRPREGRRQRGAEHTSGGGVTDRWAERDRERRARRRAREAAERRHEELKEAWRRRRAGGEGKKGRPDGGRPG